MAYRRKVDGNHGEVVQALEAIGASVVDTSRFGTGFPDLVVGYRHRTFLVEIKSDRGKLNARQVKFASGWRGSPILVVRSGPDAVEQLLKACGACR